MQGLARAVCVKLIKAAENAVSPHPVSTTLGSNGTAFLEAFFAAISREAHCMLALLVCSNVHALLSY